MTKRYSGQLTIELTITADCRAYLANVRGPCSAWKTYVSASSPIDDASYDTAAQEALSILADVEDRGGTDVDLIQYADWDIDGPFVTRMRLEAA